MSPHFLVRAAGLVSSGSYQSESEWCVALLTKCVPCLVPGPWGLKDSSKLRFVLRQQSARHMLNRHEVTRAVPPHLG